MGRHPAAPLLWWTALPLILLDALLSVVLLLTALPPVLPVLQYTEPLVVDDLQGEQMKKFDGTKQYARDKRRQVGCAGGCWWGR